MPVTAKNGDGGFGAKRGVEAGLLSFQHHRVDDILVALSAERSGSRQHFKGNHPKGVHCGGKKQKSKQNDTKKQKARIGGGPKPSAVSLRATGPKTTKTQTQTGAHFAQLPRALY